MNGYDFSVPIKKATVESCLVSMFMIILNIMTSVMMGMVTKMMVMVVMMIMLGMTMLRLILVTS